MSSSLSDQRGRAPPGGFFANGFLQEETLITLSFYPMLIDCEALGETHGIPKCLSQK